MKNSFVLPVISALLIVLLAAGCIAPQPPAENVTPPQVNVTPPVQVTPPAQNATQTVPSQPGGNFNAPGNVLITDQYNNRVIEVNPTTGNIVWSFGSNDPGRCDPGPGTIIGTNYAERLSDGLTLIAGTGIPAGADDAMPDGCADNRVIVVNQAGDILWQYGQANVTGSDENELSTPVAAIQLPNGDYLITDQGNNRIIEVNVAKQIVWSYGPASGSGALNSPNSAELLDNGHILIADENNNRTIEITRDGNIVWEYGTGIAADAFSSREADGGTLIVDSGNSRIIEVTQDKTVAFEYFTNTETASNSDPLPTNAVLLNNGNIMIADQFNHRAFAINPQKQVVWQYGKTNVSGNGADELNGPYSAFVIGDYTGQTAPPASTNPATQNATPAPAAVKVSNSMAYGQVLTDANGMTLYVFNQDSNYTSTCASECAQTWPPVVSDTTPMVAGARGTFGLLTRTDGTMQVAYNGMPLYRYSQDRNPGDTLGNGINGWWYVATTNLTTFPQPPPPPPSQGYGHGY